MPCVHAATSQLNGANFILLRMFLPTALSFQCLQSKIKGCSFFYMFLWLSSAKQFLCGKFMAVSFRHTDAHKIKSKRGYRSTQRLRGLCSPSCSLPPTIPSCDVVLCSTFICFDHFIIYTSFPFSPKLLPKHPKAEKKLLQMAAQKSVI